MTAEQRAELVKCIVKDGSYKKLAFNECREMAKALNLNLEQVLRVYYDMRQKHLNSFQGVPNTQVKNTCAVYNTHPSSLKRKKMSSEATLSKHLKVNPTDELFEDFHLEPVEEHDVHEQQEQHSSFISQWALPKLKHTRQTKFSWTEEADRQLLIQYARQRAAQGARRGTDWASMTHLPAPPDTCRRRMAVLRRDKNFTKALMRLCNLLTQRYSHHLDKAQKINLVDDGEDDQQSELQEEQWDNFGEPKIKMAFDEVLIFKQIAKMDAAKGAGSVSEGTHRTFTATPSEVENHCGRQHVNSSQRASCYRLPGNFIKHLNGVINITRQVHESLAISNAVELLKLVFLSTSNSAEVPNLLAETLRCYSEIDLFSAFNYLKEKKIMVGSNGSQPYVLSQHFLHSLSLSQFPTNTGKRAARFASWICERETELMEGTVNLTSDLQCGDILNLLALVSSEELSISPVLPDEGIGEAEDSRSLKRKFDDNESGDVDKVKKRQYHSLQESEIFSRREKGFPGITVSLSRSVISRSNVYEFLKDEIESPLQPGEDVDFFAALGQKISSSSPIDYMKEASDFSSVIPISISCSESQWEAMSNYAEQVMRHSVEEQPQIYPVVFQTTYTAIQNAGDQGLSMQEVSAVINMQGAKMAEYVVDVLQAFGQAVKVNGYDSVHVVDALYRSKYSLTSKAAPYQVLEMAAPMNSPRVNGNRKVAKKHGTSGSEVDSQMGATLSVNDVHKITILNLSEEVRQHSNADGLEVCAHSNMISTVVGKDENFHASFPGIFCPILPWINGDGTTNDIVYRGLTRRILGIVMQNPGISEDNVLHQMEALNPQSCRKLLELMILDNHLLVRKMLQTTSYGPPSLLKSLLGSRFRRPEYVSREHYFANPMSASLL
ncbi:hypothetical protein Nepgr_019990 [Nepenthes gracilis]|uniref:Uncharacterized protein n=1 Tax=Nepenthes gracilis TaxID=150966 RepID=A0AAD3XVL3_NEPGR|nr:hypothetical protein Nepgr_019990 [Nepenthes gracilis]